MVLDLTCLHPPFSLLPARAPFTLAEYYQLTATPNFRDSNYSTRDNTIEGGGVYFSALNSVLNSAGAPHLPLNVDLFGADHLTSEVNSGASPLRNVDFSSGGNHTARESDAHFPELALVDVALQNAARLAALSNFPHASPQTTNLSEASQLASMPGNAAESTRTPGADRTASNATEAPSPAPARSGGATRRRLLRDFAARLNPGSSSRRSGRDAGEQE
jgi:hypothetical protein